jgi:flagella basal body P-ring formation protein FlgA
VEFSVKKKHFLVLGFLFTIFCFLQTTLAFSAEVTKTQLESLVTQYVKDKIQTYRGKSVNTTGEKLSIKILGIPGAPFRFPDTQAIQLSCDTSSWNSLWSDRGLVRVTMSDNTGRSREIGIPVQVIIQKNIWVVRNRVISHSPVAPKDLSLEFRDVSANYGYTADESLDLTQYVARVNLLPGEWLDIRKLEIPPDVRYNDDVSLIMTGPNGMELTVPGVALANGQIGQTIPVRQAQFQQKHYVGKIIAKRQVQVEL